MPIHPPEHPPGPLETTSDSPLDLSVKTPLVELSSASGRGAEEAVATRQDLRAGKVLAGRYRILRLLGRGGMGEVFQAEDLVLGQAVALKLLPTSLEGYTEHQRRLLEEVRLARQVTHANICRVHHVEEVDGIFFLTMEWIDGETLAERLEREGRLPGTQTVEIAHQICRGLTAAHERGVLHRDLKPANIMIDRQGMVRLTDFGLAALAEETEEDKSLGLGTPSYMAPELFNGCPASVRSDLYALGAVLYKLVTGRPTLNARSVQELAILVHDTAPEPPSSHVKNLDAALERTILRCLEKNPQKRPLSALEVAAMLPTTASGAGTRHTLLLTEIVGRESWQKKPEDDTPRRLDTLCQDVVQGLLGEHGGRRSVGNDAPFVFERPIHAVRFALEYQRRLAELAETGEIPHLALRGAVHLGETVFTEGEPEVTRPDWDVVSRLRTLGSRHQILMTRQAFDLARQTAAAELEGVRWLAHGNYEIDGLPEPLELFEVGRRDLSPLRPPPDSPRARRRIVQDTVGGWRPAPGLELPRRPGWRVGGKLHDGGFGEVWTVEHPASGEIRVFKFCYDAQRLRSLQREITLFRLLKEELGERDDIARILDWSFEEAPYFIEVEHTAGGDLATWADSRGGLDRIPLATRLDLVAQMATALAAAHSVGVLHKDVKPANILIGENDDGSPRAILADFGIGDVTEQQRLHQVGITALGLTRELGSTAEGSSQSGTHIYMAPEVVTGRRATLPSDVYALGVTLYQMVTGDLSRSLSPGWRRFVPDELLREDIAAAADLVPERRLSAAQLAERLRRLDRRRSERAAAERELEEGRKARKTIARWRRRRRVMIAALAVMAIFASVIFMQSRRIAREAETSSRVTAFLVDLFKLSDPEIALGEDISAREILHRGSKKIITELADQPEIQATLMETIGKVSYNLGAYDQAEEMFRQSWLIRRELHGPEHLEVALSLAGLGKTLTARGELAPAANKLNRAVEIYRARLGDGSLQEAEALEDLGVTLVQLRRYDEADASFDASYRIRRDLLGDDDPEIAALLNRWASLPATLHEYPRAESFLQQALDILGTRHGRRGPKAAELLYHLGGTRYMQDRYESAEEYLVEALEIQRGVLDPDHPATWRTRLLIAKLHHALANDRLSEDMYEKAEKEILSLLASAESTRPENHSWLSAIQFELALLYRSWGKLEQSERYFKRALERHLRQESLPAPDPSAALFERFLALVQHEQGRTDIAEPRLRAAFEVLKEAWTLENIYTATTAVELAELLISKGDYEEAASLLEEALAAYSELPGIELWRALRAEALRAACLDASGEIELAEQILTEVRSQAKSLRGTKARRIEEALRTAADVGS